MTTFTDFYRSNRSRLDGILFDADGTLTANRKALPGANELLALLEEEHFPFLLLTNDSGRSPAEKSDVLKQAGVTLAPERIYSSGMILKQWAERFYHGELFFQSGRLGEPNYADAAGIRVTCNPARADECRGVIMGEGLFDWKITTETIFKILFNHPNVPWLVPNPDCFWSRDRDGAAHVGDGGVARFIALLLKEAGISRTPDWLGKPCKPMYHCASKMLFRDKPYEPARIAMIGDSLDSDIAGANACGLLSCLVLTGVSSRKLADEADEARRPAMIFDKI